MDRSQQPGGSLDHALTREDVADIRSPPFYFGWRATPPPAAKTSHVLDHRLELVNDMIPRMGRSAPNDRLGSRQKVAKFRSWFSTASWTIGRNRAQWRTVASRHAQLRLPFLGHPRRGASDVRA